MQKLACVLDTDGTKPQALNRRQARRRPIFAAARGLGVCVVRTIVGLKPTTVLSKGLSIIYRNPYRTWLLMVRFLIPVPPRTDYSPHEFISRTESALLSPSLET